MRRRNNYHLALTPHQDAVIDNVARGLDPDVRCSFLLHVSLQLRMSVSAPGYVSDVLLGRAIDTALREMPP